MTHQDGEVLVVAADSEFRALVTQVLSRIGCALREAETGGGALDLARRDRPNCVVLDVMLPDMTGYAVCQELRETYGDQLSIIFVSGDHTEPMDRVAGLLLGADDYVVMPFDPDEFVARVRRGLARGQRSVQPESLTPVGVGELTPREREVLALLADGHDQTAIADHLFISPTTVSTHIQRILSKLGVHSRAQAVAVAHLERLVEPAGQQIEAMLTDTTRTESVRIDQSRQIDVTVSHRGGEPDRRSGERRLGVVTNSSADPNNIATAVQERVDARSSDVEADLQPAGSNVTFIGAPSTVRSADVSIEPGLNGTAPWWLEPATARARVSTATGELTEISTDSSALMGGEPEDAVGRHFMDFVLPEARADASSFFDLVRREGEIHSRASVRRGDGSMLTIEIRAVDHGDSIDVAYRPLNVDEPRA